MTTTKDEALRVAMQSALTWMENHGEVVFAGGGWPAIDSMNKCVTDLRSALRTIALAVEGSADGGSSQEASTCPHGVPHRWPCDQCDAAFLPGTSNDQQEN